MGKAHVAYFLFYSLITSFSTMKHLHLTEIVFGGAAPLPGASGCDAHSISLSNLSTEKAIDSHCCVLTQRCDCRL